MKFISSLIAASIVCISSVSFGADKKDSYTGVFEETRVVDSGRSETYNFTRQYGYETIVIVIGNGDSDLDCHVFHDGQMIGEDTSWLDVCVISVEVFDREPLEIFVRNIGNYSNEYKIVVL